MLLVLPPHSDRLVLTPDAATMLDLVNSGEFTKALRTDAAARILASLQAPDAGADAFETLLVGVAAYALFAQDNWTGPPTSSLPESLLPGLSYSQDQISQAFAADGEVLRAIVDSPLFFVAAKALIGRAEAQLEQAYPLALLWAARVHFAQQQLLETTSASLYDAIVVRAEKLLAAAQLAELPVDVRAAMHLELGLQRHYYREIHAARQHFEQARSILGLQLDLSGALGVRTKFQQKELAQLFLDVTSASSASASDQPQAELPKDVELNDDTLLEAVAFSGSQGESASLSHIEQAAILAMCLDVKNNNPQDGLTTEEMFPYVERVLRNSCRHWTTHFVALLIRSRLERELSRKMTRALMQLQALVDDRRGIRPPVHERLDFMHATALPSFQMLQFELGEGYLALGLPREALGIFEALQQWENVITCYQLLQQDGKAEALVRKCLDDEPTPKLWCILGDITNKEEHYFHAWDMSGQKFPRAMRSLGRKFLRLAEHHLKQNESDLAQANYKKAIDYFGQSLALNSRQPEVWFSYGCAAQQAEEHGIAAKAFRRKVDFDPDDYQSWNNLARAHIKLHDKPKAFVALREATKQAFDKIKVWENFALIAVDVGAFRDAIFAGRRLLELQQKFDDYDVCGWCFVPAAPAARRCSTSWSPPSS